MKMPAGRLLNWLLFKCSRYSWERPAKTVAGRVLS